MGINRIASIDIARGAVMVLMAIDHVRVYSGLPAGGPTPGIFFTRWVTHFCAPAFAFFAGTSAYLYGRKLARSRPSNSSHLQALSRYLFTRGLILIALELTLIRFAWTFNLDVAHYILAGVIWMLGWCLILLAALVHLPMMAITVLGVVIVAGHNLLDPRFAELLESAQASPAGWLWQVLYFGPAWPSEGPFVVLYSLVPWVGVAALGYGFGAILEMDPARRRGLCWSIGAAATAAFIVLRTTNVYGDPRPWNGSSIFAFLNTAKYPASLQFLLMTLGPTIAMLPFLENARGRFAQMLEIFGRVPFFYYLLHIPVIHLAALLVSYLREGHVNGWLFANHPMRNPLPPDGYTWSLALMYAVFIASVAVLYPLCRWFAGFKVKVATVEATASSGSPARWVKYV